MGLVCNATTLNELRAEIVSMIRHRAWQERAVIGIMSKAKRDAEAHEQAARELDNLAADLERMEIVNQRRGIAEGEYTERERFAEQSTHNRHHD